MQDKDFKEFMEWKPVNFTERELSYRKGFHQGFFAARNNPEISEDQVKKWRYSENKTAPPGSSFSGKDMNGLTKEDEHRFFENRVKENWSD